MLDVTIKGFQSIEEVHLSIDGFTALVGRSNLGKSAIVRAVRSALTNALGTDFVRHGSFCSRRIRGTKKCKCSCTVHLQTEGFDLLWEKGDEVNQYTFNGEVYSRPDRGIPDFLLQDFSLVKIGTKQQLIQIADQAEPIFLLNQSGMVVADVLSDVAKLDDINVAMADVEKDRREAVSTLKVRERDSLELQALLQPYEGLEEPTQKAQQVSQLFDMIQAISRQADALDRFHTRMAELGTGVRQLLPVDDVQIPDIEPVGLSEKGFSVLLRFETELEEKTSSVAALEPVEDLPEPDASGLEAGNQAVLLFEEWLAKVAHLKVVLIGWKEIENSPDPSEASLQIVHALLQVSAFEAEHKMLVDAVDELEGIELTQDPVQPVQDVEGLLQLTSFSEKFDFLTKTVGTLQATLSELEAREQAVLQEWAVLGMCPTCSQTVSEGHQIHFDA